MKNLSMDIHTGVSRADTLLPWAVVQSAKALRLNDLVGLVCQRGLHYGTVGRIVDYRGTELDLVFADGSRETFRGPALERLDEPSLEVYEVEPFYIGDLTQNGHSPSDSYNKKEIHSSMKSVNRTHIGLMRLSGQIGEGCAVHCAQTVQELLRPKRKNQTGESQ